MVWLTIPSARPAAEAQELFAKWTRMGYRLALWRDPGAAPVECDLLIQQPYPGYAKAVNALVAAVLENDPSCNFCIAAGDDIEPDPTKRAEVIERECVEQYGTFSLIQFTGDPWADSAGRMIERIAGSPWIGREFAERINRGRGPYNEIYTHCFLDNEIMEVAKKYGVFYQRPDLTQHHAHWTRERRPMPSYLADANSQSHWQRFIGIYHNRRAAGFPGSEPIRWAGDNR